MPPEPSSSGSSFPSGGCASNCGAISGGNLCPLDAAAVSYSCSGNILTEWETTCDLSGGTLKNQVGAPLDCASFGLQCVQGYSMCGISCPYGWCPPGTTCGTGVADDGAAIQCIAPSQVDAAIDAGREASDAELEVSSDE